MSSFINAVKEYFTVDEKPRLHKKDTWFEDHGLSDGIADLFWITVTVLAMLLLIIMTLKVVSL